MLALQHGDAAAFVGEHLAARAATLGDAVDALVIHGSVDSVVDQLLAFRDRVGDFGTLLCAAHDWADPALGRRSMELMATEAIRRIDAAVGAEAAE